MPKLSVQVMVKSPWHEKSRFPLDPLKIPEDEKEEKVEERER